jgi:hypothetical protein
LDALQNLKRGAMNGGCQRLLAGFAVGGFVGGFCAAAIQRSFPELNMAIAIAGGGLVGFAMIWVTYHVLR